MALLFPKSADKYVRIIGAVMALGAVGTLAHTRSFLIRRWSNRDIHRCNPFLTVTSCMPAILAWTAPIVITR